MIEDDLKYFKENFTHNKPPSSHRIMDTHSAKDLLTPSIDSKWNNQEYNNISTVNNNFIQTYEVRSAKKNNQMDVLHELKNEHDFLKKMQFQPSYHETEDDEQQSVIEFNDASTKEIKKGYQIYKNQKQIVNLNTLKSQKKKLQNELTAKMRKIEELLINQRKLQEEIHHLKIELDGKHDQKDCSKVIRKLKSVESELTQRYQRELAEVTRLKRQLIKSEQDRRQLNQQCQRLEQSYNIQYKKNDQSKQNILQLISQVKNKQSEAKKMKKSLQESFYYKEIQYQGIIKKLEEQISRKQYDLRRNNYDKEYEIKQALKKMEESLNKTHQEEFRRVESQKQQEIRKLKQNSTTNVQLNSIDNVLKIQVQQLNSKCRSLQNQIINIKNENNQLIEQLNKKSEQQPKQSRRKTSEEEIRKLLREKDQQWTHRLTELIGQEKQSNMAHFQKIITQVLSLNRLKEVEVQELRRDKLEIQKNYRSLQAEYKMKINNLNDVNQNLRTSRPVREVPSRAEEQLKLEVVKLKQQITNLRDNTTSSQIFNESKIKIANLNNEIDGLKKFIKEQNLAKKQFLQDLENSQQRTKNIYDENQALKAQVNELKMKLEYQTQHEIGTRNREIQIKSNLVQDMKNGMTALNSHITLLQQKQRQNQKVVDKLKDSLASKQRFIYELNQQMEERSAGLRIEFQREMEMRDSQIIANKQIILEMKKHLADSKNQVQGLQRELETMEKHYKQSLEQINRHANLSNKQITTTVQTNTHNNQIELLKQHVAKLEQALAPIQPRTPPILYQQLIIQLNNTSAQYNKLNTEFNQAKSHFSAVMGQYETKLKSAEQPFRQKENRYVERIALLENECKKLNQQLQADRSRNNSVNRITLDEKQLAHLQSEWNAKEKSYLEKVHNLENGYSQISVELENLKKKYEQHLNEQNPRIANMKSEWNTKEAAYIQAIKQHQAKYNALNQQLHAHTHTNANNAKTIQQEVEHRLAHQQLDWQKRQLELRKKITQLEDGYNTLKHAHQNMRQQQVAQLQGYVNKLAQQNADWIKKNQSMQKKISDLQSERQKLNEFIISIKEQQANESKERQQQLEQLLNNLQISHQQNDRMKNQVADMQKRMYSQEELINSLKSQQQSSRQTINSTQNIEQMHEKILNNSQKITGKTGNISEKQKEYQSLLKSYNMLFHKMNTEIGTLKSENQKLSKFKTKEQAYHQEINSLKNQLNTTIINQKNELNKLRSSISSNTNSKASEDLLIQKHLFDDKQREYLQKINFWSTQFEELKEQYENHQKTTHKRQLEYKSQANNHQQLLQRVRTLQKQIQDKEEEINLLAQVQKAQTQELEAACSQNQSFKKQIQQIKTSHHSNLEQIKTVHEQQLSQKVNTTGELDYLRQTNRRLLQQNQHMKAQFNQLVTSNQQIHAILKDKNRAIEHLWSVKQVEYQNVSDHISRLKELVKY